MTSPSACQRSQRRCVLVAAVASARSACRAARRHAARVAIYSSVAWLISWNGAALRAAVYHLAPEGSDENPGTRERPMHSLNKAWTRIAPGDVVYLHGGDYRYDRMQSLTGRSGTAERPIRIWAWPGDLPRVTRGPGYVVRVGVDHELIYFEGSHFHWRGIEVAHFEQQRGDRAWSAFRVQDGSHCTFEQLRYHHNGAGMSLRGDSTGNLFLNCDFHHNQDPHSETPYDGADGLDLHFLRTGCSNTLRGCRAWWNSDDGFDYWENEGAVLIEDCWSFYNGFRPDTFEKAGNGSGFKLGSTTARPDADLRTIRNCLAFKNRSFGIVENGAVCRSQVYHNVCAQHGVYGFWFGSWGRNVATVRNNIGWRNPEERFSEFDVVAHNSWQDGLSAAESDFLSVDPSPLTRPRQTDGRLPPSTFLRLKAASRLARAGVDVGVPFRGTSPDLGIVEPPPRAAVP